MKTYNIMLRNLSNRFDGGNLVRFTVPDDSRITLRAIYDELVYIIDEKENEIEESEELLYHYDLEARMLEELADRFPGLDWEYVVCEVLDYRLDCYI